MKALSRHQPKIFGPKQASFAREISAGRRQQGKGVKCLGSSIHHEGREHDMTFKEQALEQLNLPAGTRTPKTWPQAV